MGQLAIKLLSLFLPEYKYAFRLTIFLSLIFVLLVFFSGGNEKIIAIFPVAIVLLVITSNFLLSLTVLVILLFIDYPIFIYRAAVLFSIPLGIAFLIKNKNIEWKELNNQLTLPIIIYSICILPSLLNATKLLMSFYMLFNFVAFLIVLYSIYGGVRTYTEINKIVMVYLFLTFANSLDVIRLSFEGAGRPYGFAGLMFVDYSALGVCLTITIALISSGFKRIVLFSTSIIIVIALIMTQTRNTWISTVITLGILVVYLIIHPEIIGISRKRILVFTTLGALLITIVILFALILNPSVESRSTQLLDKKSNIIDQYGGTESSIVTRMLIWDTAINAFLSHPVIGIGVYAFPFSSNQYYKIHKILYEKYVKDLSPHQTHLAVLVETGVIGFIGFMIFIISILKISLKSVKSAINQNKKKYSLVALISVVYCIVSMFFTDAWLWGKGIILFGIVVGLMLVNSRISSEC